MTPLRLGWTCGIAAVVVAVACSSDEPAGNVAAGGSSGNPSGGTAGSGQAGSVQSDAGKAGSPVPQGGSSAGAAVGGNAGHNVGGMGQAGAEDAAAGESSMSSAGAGGMDACGAAPESLVHSCSSVLASWAPSYDPALKRVALNVSALPMQFVSGQLWYYYSDGNAHGCGFVEVTLAGDLVLATLPLPVTPTLVGVARFELTDACDTRHDFELGDAASCVALEWSTASGWTCANRIGACVDLC